MPAPQAVSNGYVSSQTGGILRFSHGKMTSSYHVRHRQDRDRNQKESYLTGSIKNPLNRYSRQIGLGVGVDKNSIGKQTNAEVIDLEDGVNPDLEVGPSVPDSGLDGASTTLWCYFMPLNSFTCKCNKCQRTLNISSSEETTLGISSSPMVEHLMKCLEPSEYKDFIKKRETRYENEKKDIEKEKKIEVEANLRKGPLLTSVVKGAPIWSLFKPMTTFLPSGLPASENATCMVKNCFKVIRIVRESATAMIVHLAQEHEILHDIYNQNYKRSVRELRELITEHNDEVEKLLKSEKATKLLDKISKGDTNTMRHNISKVDNKDVRDNGDYLSFNNYWRSDSLIPGNKRNKKGSSYEEDDKTTKEYERFSNSESTLRDFFVPLGTLYAKCKNCHTTIGVEVSLNSILTRFSNLFTRNIGYIMKINSTPYFILGEV